MTQEEFRARFKGSPLKRTKRRGLLRNVTVALGSWGAEAVPTLAVALNDEEELVRGHATWALGRIGTEAARHALRGGKRGGRTRGRGRRSRRRWRSRPGDRPPFEGNRPATRSVPVPRRRLRVRGAPGTRTAS
ncbi:HEAT repeat domain-containing protein [Longimicrobium sp.]|uniref:HEAT repeat domain-containing protein n=1 Tax=Longimicrobium sp. TaxID=2029185 RepID=UPI0032C22560